MLSIPERLIVGSEVLIRNGRGAVTAKVFSIPLSSYCMVVDGDGGVYAISLIAGEEDTEVVHRLKPTAPVSAVEFDPLAACST